MTQDPGHSALLVDLYQLTMLQGYFVHEMHEPASFEFFIRKLPADRNFFVAAGLQQVLEFLESVRFTDGDLQFLKSTGSFRDDFLEWLGEWRFDGRVDAMLEGTICFPNEPLLRVTAPLPSAQLVESRIINILHFQTLIASKAIRCRLAAGERTLVDFGLRRAHGAEAGLLAARACYLAGFNGTATVLAGQRFGIPVSGTMAHSFIQAHRDERAAFTRFAEANPENVVLLIDTYDTVAGARKVAELAEHFRSRNITVRGVRLDSGDMAELARQVRPILDEGGLTGTQIFASGGLDEDGIAKLVQSGAPIDGFGVGTRLDASADAPYLDCAYKLVEYNREPRLKKSTNKVSLPGRKQVYRLMDSGVAIRDVIALVDQEHAGEPLLRHVMTDGRATDSPAPLSTIRDHLTDSLSTLPAAYRELRKADEFPVDIDPLLQNLTDRLIAEAG